jgi:hypothetical protein
MKRAAGSEGRSLCLNEKDDGVKINLNTRREGKSSSNANL